MSKTETVKTRVAVYIRIGGSGDVKASFEKQAAHFKAFIGKRSDWELAEIYADLGADSRKQPHLQRLLADCRAGRIDLVVTKSSSRISRSMNLLMNFVRELAYLKPPVGVYFEDTKLNTLSKDNFLFLSMYEVMSLDKGCNSGDKIPSMLLTRYLKNQQKKHKNPKGDEDDE